ncbi:unnamed protein product [Amoebophrya sp. A25]|nr:unnamed protein product [Amoebophrya sp. A25]|eukprot:GSA25T00004259001.1
MECLEDLPAQIANCIPGNGLQTRAPPASRNFTNYGPGYQAEKGRQYPIPHTDELFFCSNPLVRSTELASSSSSATQPATELSGGFTAASAGVPGQGNAGMPPGTGASSAGSASANVAAGSSGATAYGEHLQSGKKSLSSLLSETGSLRPSSAKSDAKGSEAGMASRPGSRAGTQDELVLMDYNRVQTLAHQRYQAFNRGKGGRLQRTMSDQDGGPPGGQAPGGQSHPAAGGQPQQHLGGAAMVPQQHLAGVQQSGGLVGPAANGATVSHLVNSGMQQGDQRVDPARAPTTILLQGLHAFTKYSVEEVAQMIMKGDVVAKEPLRKVLHETNSDPCRCAKEYANLILNCHAIVDAYNVQQFYHRLPVPMGPGSATGVQGVTGMGQTSIGQNMNAFNTSMNSGNSMVPVSNVQNLMGGGQNLMGGGQNLMQQTPNMSQPGAQQLSGMQQPVGMQQAALQQAGTQQATMQQTNLGQHRCSKQV